MVVVVVEVVMVVSMFFAKCPQKLIGIKSSFFFSSSPFTLC